MNISIQKAIQIHIKSTTETMTIQHQVTKGKKPLEYLIINHASAVVYQPVSSTINRQNYLLNKFIFIRRILVSLNLHITLTYSEHFSGQLNPNIRTRT